VADFLHQDYLEELELTSRGIHISLSWLFVHGIELREANWAIPLPDRDPQ
jgi:hypothetical protein